MSDQTFQHGDGCCGCNCTEGPIGTGGCCLTCCCPCISFCQAAENSKVDELGIAYLVFGFLGFNCCSAVALGMHVEEKRGLKPHGVGWVNTSYFSSLTALYFLFCLANNGSHSNACYYIFSFTAHAPCLLRRVHLPHLSRGQRVQGVRERRGRRICCS